MKFRLNPNNLRLNKMIIFNNKILILQFKFKIFNKFGDNKEFTWSWNWKYKEQVEGKYLTKSKPCLSCGFVVCE